MKKPNNLKKAKKTPNKPTPRPSKTNTKKIKLYLLIILAGI